MTSDKQDCCRRILRIAADRWLNPAGWTFKAIFEDGVLNYVLIASAFRGDHKIEQRVVFRMRLVEDAGEQLTMENMVSRASAEAEDKLQRCPQ